MNGTSDLGLLAALLVPLTGPEPLDADDRQGMLPQVCAAMLPDKTREPSSQARMLIVETILVL